MTLADCGKWYSATYKDTPPATLTATSGWRGEDMCSAWYYSKHYRTNLFWNEGIVRLRDLYVFNERYHELYLTERCDTHACQYRNLPVIDGQIYTNPEKGLVAGIYLCVDGTPIRWDSYAYAEDDGSATVTLKSSVGQAIVTCSERGISINTDVIGLTLKPVYDRENALGVGTSADIFANHNNSKTNLSYISSCRTSGREIQFTFEGFDYSIDVEKGTLCEDLSVLAENGKIKLCLAQI